MKLSLVIAAAMFALVGCTRPVSITQTTALPGQDPSTLDDQDPGFLTEMPAGDAVKVSLLNYHDGFDTGDWYPCDGTLTSSNPAVVRIDRVANDASSWLVVGVGEGMATLTATCDDVPDEEKVTVTAPILP